MQELLGFLSVKSVKEGELSGRTSGSQAWRRFRGEAGIREVSRKVCNATSHYIMLLYATLKQCSTTLQAHDSRVQHSTEKHHSMTQQNRTAQHSTAQRSAAQHRTKHRAEQSRALHSTEQRTGQDKTAEQNRTEHSRTQKYEQE